MVDAKVSKTFGPQDHAGSIPAPGTFYTLPLRIRWILYLITAILGTRMAV